MSEDKQLELDFGGEPKPKRKPAIRKKSGTQAKHVEEKPASTKGKSTRKTTSSTPRKKSPPKSKPLPKQEKPVILEPVTTQLLLPPPPPRMEVVLPEIGERKGYKTPISHTLLVIAVTLGVLFCLLGLLVILQTQRRQESVSVSSGGDKAISTASVAVEIHAGMSARQVAVLLEENGIIRSSDAFISYLMAQDLAGKLRSGTYLFEKGMDQEVVARMLTGVSEKLSVVVSNGSTLKAVDGYLSQRGYADEGKFLKAAEALVASDGLSFSEGWFLAGTYAVRREDAANDLAVQMHQAMLAALVPVTGSAVVKDLGVEDVLVIASLIQAETQNEAEMPLISGIIQNRLKADIPLGIDATTRYETGDWTHAIAQDVFEKQTPYNTRRKTGLPPGGICCPGEAALKAAASPLATDALFYLHGKDGTIHTAKDYQGHQKNIRLYL